MLENYRKYKKKQLDANFENLDLEKYDCSDSCKFNTC